jgi:hypothetical protein
MTSLYAPLFTDEPVEKISTAPAASEASKENVQESGQNSTPLLLEYHAESDPDIHYIPKVTGCFALGALAMGIALNMAVLLLSRHISDQIVYTVTLRMAFVIGITGVGASLLLVGLKVRDDHTSKILFPRHWLNALGTGGLFSVIVWLPYLVVDGGVISVSINRFVLAAIWMALMAFPGIAALWVVGPHPDKHAQSASA